MREGEEEGRGAGESFPSSKRPREESGISAAVITSPLLLSFLDLGDGAGELTSLGGGITLSPRRRRAKEVHLLAGKLC